MKRLTKRNSCGVEIVGNKARQALNRLAEYEDIGMTADEIKYFLRDYGISQAIEIRKLGAKIEELEEEVMRLTVANINLIQEKLSELY